MAIAKPMTPSMYEYRPDQAYFRSKSFSTPNFNASEETQLCDKCKAKLKFKA